VGRAVETRVQGQLGQQSETIIKSKIIRRIIISYLAIFNFMSL
jgi:hypothetical protein